MRTPLDLMPSLTAMAFSVAITFKDRLHTFFQLFGKLLDPFFLRFPVRTSVVFLICQFGLLPPTHTHMFLCPHRDRMAYLSAWRTGTARHMGICFYVWDSCPCSNRCNKKDADFFAPASHIYLICFSHFPPSSHEKSRERHCPRLCI